MNILHIIHNLDTGGAEKLLLGFVKQYKASYKHDSHYLVTLTDNNPLLEEVVSYLDEFVCLKFQKINFLKSALLLKGLLSKWKIDVIHSHLFYSTIMARLARGKNSSIRMVTTYHNMEYCPESPTFSWKFPFIDKLTVPNINCHQIFVSKPVANCVTKQVPSIRNFSILPNFVSKEFNAQYKFNDDGRLRLVAVGSLRTVKNHMYALEELKLLNDKRISLDIYGKGELYEDLMHYIKQHSLQVQLKGNVKMSSGLLASYDAFLMTSVSEGMPLSLIEAITTGLPSVVTDLPQLRETAEDAAIYFKHESGELSKLLKSILDNKIMLEVVAGKTQRVKGKFEIENYVERVRQIYQGTV